MANNEEKQINANVQEDLVENTSSQKNYLGAALVIFVVLSLVSSVWLYLQQLQLTAQAKVQSSTLEKLVEENQGLSRLIGQSEKLLTGFEQDQKALTTTLTELSEKKQLSTADISAVWSLHEVEFLLNVANQRALLAHDIDSAKIALQMADSKIQQMEDYRLHPLRALITEELMTLDAMDDVNQSGIGLQLLGAAKNVENLQVASGPQINQVAQVTPNEVEEGWQKAVKDIWGELRSLVVVRHSESGEIPVLTPEQQYFLYQNLSLKLESARLSLLLSDKAGFEQSLVSAIEWLERYFVGSERDAMVTTLSSMQHKPIQINVPDISASLEWLQDFQQ